MLRIDTHRHLGGCIPPSFVWQVIQENNLKHLAESEQEVVEQMTFSHDEPKGFHRFLDKFRILDGITWTEDLIDRSNKAICEGLEKEGIDYAFLDFSINKYMGLKWHKHEAIQFIRDSFERHAPGKIGLILSLKYESMKASQRQYAKLIEHPVAAECLVGLDLVGDEEYFDSSFYEPIFNDWNKEKKLTRAHVGESQSMWNIIEAMQVLKVTNVAHGFKILENKEGMAWAKDREICFDTTITSNYLTDVWGDPVSHPSIEMHRAGLRVTLGSDDPVQCSTTLNREFQRAKSLGLTESESEALERNAVGLYFHYAQLAD